MTFDRATCGHPEAVIVVMLLVGCIATPLPLPPEMDPKRMELREVEVDQVRFIGDAGALEPPTGRAILVTNIDREESVLFFSGDDGGFEVVLAGALGEVYRFSLHDTVDPRVLLECTTDGVGGVRDATVPPDTPEDPADLDGDGFDNSVDCDDANPAINPAAPETCDGLDNDCDGEIDEACADQCVDDGDCDDGLFCDGVEQCTLGQCSSPAPPDCDDGDSETLDICSEIARACFYE